jgi:hypothetical protein
MSKHSLITKTTTKKKMLQTKTTTTILIRMLSLPTKLVPDEKESTNMTEKHSSNR